MAENIVEGFRKVIQDLVVPEFKALQGEVKHLGERVASQGEELKLLRSEMCARFEKVDERFEKIDARFEKVDERFECVLREMRELREAAMAEINARHQETLHRFIEQGHVLGKIEGTLSMVNVKMDYLERVERVEEVLRRITAKIGIEF
ncbi:MAG: hypothetical protein HY318_14040 [Armatimonadetes bacterium]|nr:hypothetical protein [Armatimonadota bacterium]